MTFYLKTYLYHLDTLYVLQDGDIFNFVTIIYGINTIYTFITIIIHVNYYADCLIFNKLTCNFIYAERIVYVM